MLCPLAPENLYDQQHAGLMLCLQGNEWRLVHIAYLSHMTNVSAGRRRMLMDSQLGVEPASPARLLHQVNSCMKDLLST